ncbi:hypothetical protein NL459_28795, partial [Klebsiella pneumoniae]|nr:hypothetical protein [Klebsiella pneumoniae]
MATSPAPIPALVLQPRADARLGRLLRSWRTVLALLALYFIWGSTYLAMRLAIVGVPPFRMAGVRFCIAGALLYA